MAALIWCRAAMYIELTLDNLTTKGDGNGNGKIAFDLRKLWKRR